MFDTDLMLFVQRVAIYAIPAVFAITVHEAAHGYVARFFGDRTAEMLGRITLNPVKHIDPIGTIAVPLLLLFMKAPFIFGWAKPVPVVARNLRNPRRDMAIVAAGGPGANIVMALGWAIVLKFALSSGGGAMMATIAQMAQFGIIINAVLAVLNLLPLPPLDGGNILTNLLPRGPASSLEKLAPYGLLIIFALLITGLLGPIIRPGIEAVVSLVLRLTGLSG